MSSEVKEMVETYCKFQREFLASRLFISLTGFQPYRNMELGGQLSKYQTSRDT